MRFTRYFLSLLMLALFALPEPSMAASASIAEAAFHEAATGRLRQTQAAPSIRTGGRVPRLLPILIGAGIGCGLGGWSGSGTSRQRGECRSGFRLRSKASADKKAGHYDRKTAPTALADRPDKRSQDRTDGVRGFAPTSVSSSHPQTSDRSHRPPSERSHRRASGLRSPRPTRGPAPSASCRGR